MKSGFRAATFLFICIFFAATPAAHSSVLLISDCAGSCGHGQASLERSEPSARFGLQSHRPDVLQQRIAFLNVANLLYRRKVESIELQLFGDVRLIASREEERRDHKGFLLWTGKVEGAEDGKMVLVVRNGLVFASIYLPSSIIQIRPEEAATGHEGSGLPGGPDGRKDSGCGASLQYIIRKLKYTRNTENKGRRTEGIAVLPSRDRDYPDGSRKTILAGWARRMVELVNLERAADGVPVLEYSGRLAAAARDHAQDMALHDYCAHDLSDGRKFWQNVFDSGYPVSEVGENLAVGLATPEEAFECLISSPGHRANIIDSEFTQIGVGRAVNMASTYRYFWAQEFGAGLRKREWTSRLSAAHTPMGLFASAAKRLF